jgi:hypothetical protein
MAFGCCCSMNAIVRELANGFYGLTAGEIAMVYS